MNAYNFFRTLLIVLLFSVNNYATNSESPFTDISLTTAKEIASAEGKYVFVDFYADWCVPCKWMDETTYSDKNIINRLKSGFVPVKINIDDFDGYTLKEKYNIKILPTVIILDSKGKVIKRFEESLSPTKLNDVLSSLKVAPENKYNENVSPQNKKPDINDNRANKNPVTVKTNKSYRVQVGVFTDYANTLNLVNNINNKIDEPVVVMNSYLNNKTVYKVIVGDYESYEQAKELKANINKQFGIKGIIKIFE